MSYVLFSLALTILFGAIAYNGKNKKTTATCSVIVFLFFGLINYFGLPVMQWWGFHGVWCEAFLVSLAGFITCLFEVDKYGDSETVWKKSKYWHAAPVIVCLIAFFVMAATSWEMFNANKYQKLLTVEMVSDSTFNSEVHPIPVNKMISVDGDLAKKVAEDKLGEDLGLGSKAYIGNMTIQNITGEFTINGGKKLVFKDDLIWIAPLEHRSFWKWISNDYTDGYVIVSATDATKIYLVTEVNGRPLKMKYIESGAFGDDIERHIKNNGYASRGLTDHCLEIDPNGKPYWVLCVYDQEIGFGGENSVGVITVDPQNGDLQEYAVNEVPEWIDRIQPKDFVEYQIRCWGEYGKGWWNSCFAQVGVQEPTPGTTLVYSNGRSYWYTGIQSAGADNATNGFMLVDTRTKEAKFYRIAGMNESEAMKIAEDQPFAKAAAYKANYPVLYNVRGVPTYFMTLKGSSGNVVGYCFVAVTNRQAVGSGSSKQDAETAYLRMLKKTVQDKIQDGPVTQKTKEYTVKDIVLEGNTYYLLFEGVKGIEFTGSSEFFRELKWTKPGHKVSVSFGEGQSKVVPLDHFDNLNVEI